MNLNYDIDRELEKISKLEETNKKLLFVAWVGAIPTFSLSLLLLIVSYFLRKRINGIYSDIVNENIKMKEILTPDIIVIKDIAKHLEELKNKENESQVRLEKLKNEIKLSSKEIDKNNKLLKEIKNNVMVQDIGLNNSPLYEFLNCEGLKDRLDTIRSEQKMMILSNKAYRTKNIYGHDRVKELLKIFNLECDIAIDKVTFSNYEVMYDRIIKSFDSINRSAKSSDITLSDEYLNLKIKELYLAKEYHIRKQEEREEQKRIREELREQARIEKELKEAKKKVEKDIKHYEVALNNIDKKLNDKNISEEQKIELLNKKDELDNQLQDLQEKNSDIDYRQNNQRAGYVYIISNIGAFGENVYKIGMTRRLDPQERIDELGGASVPFNFDVHAMIFSEDAPALENNLHKTFDDRKVNMVNKRKEFFSVTLDEIESVVKKYYDKSVEFIKLAPAEQYRESIKIKEAL